MCPRILRCKRTADALDREARESRHPLRKWWIRIKDVGDTNFLVDENVEKHIFERENSRVIERGGKPGIAEPLLLGITKASLSTESFISASWWWNKS